jgi:hypothetical protein
MKAPLFIYCVEEMGQADNGKAGRPDNLIKTVMPHNLWF